jgi:hypothetical protein
MRTDPADGGNAAFRLPFDDDPSQLPQSEFAPAPRTPPAAPSQPPVAAVVPTIGPADGVWVTDYDNPLPSNALPYGPYAPHSVNLLSGDASRWQTAWTGDVNSPPDSVLQPEPLIDAQRQYQFRISGAEFDGGHNTVRVVEADGKFYMSKFYKYTIEQRDAATVTARNPTGPGVIAPGEYVFPNQPSDWKPSSYAEFSQLQNDHPDAFRSVGLSGPFTGQGQITDEYLTSVFPDQ